MITIHTFIALGIFWTSFTRALLMEKSTRFEIAVCMAFLGTCGAAMAIAPLAWGLKIDPVIIIFEGSVLAVQAITGRLWSKGIPEQFKRP